MEPMVLTSNCEELFIQSGLLEDWWRSTLYDLSINIRYNACTEYGITLPPRYRFAVVDFVCSLIDGTATATIGILDYDDAMLSMTVVSNSPQVSNIVIVNNDVTFDFSGDPVEIVLSVMVNGYTYEITVQQQLGLPDVCADGLEVDTASTVYPDIPCGTTFDFPSVTLTVEQIALLADCDLLVEENIIEYGLYTVSINDTQTACIYVDCEDILRCKVSTYMASCPQSEIGYLYHTFDTLLLNSYGNVPDCTSCNDVETFYKEILHQLCIPCPCKAPCETC
jgi:hypothetical protein